MKTERDIIVLIHGFGGKRIWMLPLAYRLSRRHRVVNWSYFSYGGSITNHAARFAKFIEGIDADCEISIVAHSMGSIVTRVALQQLAPEKVNRVVMLAPPNTGSHVARFASPILGSVCQPIRQLSSHENSYVNKLPRKHRCETGVIASRYDVLVPVKNTMMDGAAEHKTVFGTHNSLLFSSRIATMTTQFIETGKFAG